VATTKANAASTCVQVFQLQFLFVVTNSPHLYLLKDVGHVFEGRISVKNCRCVYELKYKVLVKMLQLRKLAVCFASLHICTCAYCELR
jgi:hypothetical protein